MHRSTRRAIVATSAVATSGILLGAIGNRRHIGAAQDAGGAIPSDWDVPGFTALGDLNNPSLAPGMVLELSRLTWEPGFTIDMHTHPSNDVIYFLSGEIA